MRAQASIKNELLEKVNPIVIFLTLHLCTNHTFLLMGGSWAIVGFVFGTLYRGDGILDNTLLSLGLIFLFAGGIGVIGEYFKT